MTLRRIAAELAQQRADFRQESGRLRPRALDGDVQLLLLAVGVELDIGFAIGHRRHHTRLTDRRHLGIRRFELGLPGDIAQRAVGHLSSDHDALGRPLAGQDEIPRRRLNPGELELRFLGEGENRQEEQQRKRARVGHAYTFLRLRVSSEHGNGFDFHQ